MNETPSSAQELGDPPPGRRGFLKLVSSLGATAFGALTAIPVLRAVLSPAKEQPAKENWVKVADDVALLDLSVPIRLDFVQLKNDAWVETRVLNSVWVYTDDGETFRAFSGHCTHLGCGYVYDVTKKIFQCPCHRGAFDAKTGAVLAGPPPRPLDQLKAEVRDSALYVNYLEYRLGVPERVEV
jgi:menaquinol-cytochrome c reductase iron-sulfur subunit